LIHLASFARKDGKMKNAFSSVLKCSVEKLHTCTPWGRLHDILAVELARGFTFPVVIPHASDRNETKQRKELGIVAAILFDAGRASTGSAHASARTCKQLLELQALTALLLL
jgi:hypothetical protein